MAQYIPKSALVAEIERRLDELYDLLPDASKVENGSITTSEACNTGKYTALESFRRFLNSLDVKEVDLEKEVENLIEKEKAFVTDNREVKYYNGDSFNHIYELEFIAKHFFELGLSVSNKAQKGE